MRTPVIVVNMKTYEAALGANGLEIARACESVSLETGAPIAVCPPATDLAKLAHALKIPVLAQHADDVKPGASTGRTPPEAVKASGAAGYLINHAERRLKVAEIASLVSRGRSLGLTTVVCTNDDAVSKACAALRPDFIAVEPPELIGGEISVTTAKPEIISASVEAVRSVDASVRILTGAGVKDGRDVAKALELGCDGVLLASGVIKAKDPRAVLLDLAKGLLAGKV